MKPGELAGTTMRHLLVGEAFHGRLTSPASSNEGSETIEAASHRRFGALQPIHSDVLAAVKQLVLALEAHPEDRAELDHYGSMTEPLAELIDGFMSEHQQRVS
jgi:hypothetical protein